MGRFSVLAYGSVVYSASVLAFSASAEPKGESDKSADQSDKPEGLRASKTPSQV